jgi:hypothetical protein
MQEDGWLAIAVADGAGSAKFSERGAELATLACIQYCENALSEMSDTAEGILQAAFLVARQRVIQEAEQLSAQPRDFATTLLLVVAGPTGGAAAQIGDGIIAVKEIGDDWAWVFWPQRGEYANVTRFVTDEDALSVLSTCKLSQYVSEVALMTDGLEPLALHYSSRSLHAPFFEGFASPLRAAVGIGEEAQLSKQLSQFLQSTRVRDRADDDLTLVVATRA